MAERESVRRGDPRRSVNGLPKAWKAVWIDPEGEHDPEKKQPRNHRKLIGKLDKETGEVIPTGKRGPKKKERAASGTPTAGGNPEEASALRERILELEKEVQILRSRVKVLTDENRAIGEAKAESERLKLENRRMEGLISSIRKLVT